MRFFASIIALVFVAGCAGFQDRGPQTPEDRAALIQSLTQSATVAGLAAGFDEDERAEQAEVAGLIVKWTGTVRAAISDEAITWVDLKAVFKEAFPTQDLPPEVSAAVDSAVNILNIYVRPPDTSEILDSERRLYLQSFLDGVTAGATPFLSQEG